MDFFLNFNRRGFAETAASSHQVLDFCLIQK